MFPQPAEPTGAPGVTSPAAPPAARPADRVVSEPDKKLAKEWQRRIEVALKRVDAKFKTFEANRKLLAGKVSGSSEEEKVRANLHFANMAAMLPQIYAKDPEFSAQPTRAVPQAQLQAAKQFAQTVEFMLQKVIVKDARLKSQAKNVIRSAYATSVGWIKASWQEKRGLDPLIANRMKDTQDNIDRVQTLLDQVNDPQVGRDQELKLAELHQTLEGLQVQQEVTIAKGVAIDFVMSEDILIIDGSIRRVGDYARAAALGHRVWMTPEQYESNFGYKPTNKAKSYSEQSGGGSMSATGVDPSKQTLLCVWEVWSQDDNRIYYVCDGEEGFCKEPSSPEWTGKRWYPFFLVAFNEIDGSFYPLSDIELTDKLVKEYNETREDFVRDRRECLPLNVIKKGGALTPGDVENIRNRKGGDVIAVDGTPGKPLSDDIFSGQLAQIKSENYDTSASRYDMERILGGGDSSTGSITKAKTATEAEILSQGLRSRSGERQDILEDMLNELGPYALEMMLRKFSESEVKAIAGPEAQWPQMGIDEIFNLLTVEVRGGSTGKPDRLQEQDRWTKLLPIINEAVQKVAELRAQGQDALAQAVIELTRETLRRFDERIDIEQFLPKQAQGQDDPAQLKQQNFQMKQQMHAMTDQLQELTQKVERGYVQAAADIATSANPAIAVLAFRAALGEIDPAIIPPTAITAPPGQPGTTGMPAAPPQGVQPAVHPALAAHDMNSGPPPAEPAQVPPQQTAPPQQ